MITVGFWIGKKILEWALIAGVVLAYVDSGPGGDALMRLVEHIKEIVLSIDWIEVLNVVYHSVYEVVTSAFEKLPETLSECELESDCKQIPK